MVTQCTALLCPLGRCLMAILLVCQAQVKLSFSAATLTFYRLCQRCCSKWTKALLCSLSKWGDSFLCLWTLWNSLTWPEKNWALDKHEFAWDWITGFTVLNSFFLSSCPVKCETLTLNQACVPDRQPLQSWSHAFLHLWCPTTEDFQKVWILGWLQFRFKLETLLLI